MSRSLLVAALADLLFALGFLLCWDLGWLAFSKQTLLVLVNGNMLACVLAATACVGLPLARRALPAPERRQQALLLATTVCLFCAEMVAMSEEFVEWARDLQPWSALPAWGARGLSAAMILVALMSLRPAQRPKLSPGHWLALAGLALYHTTDLLYIFHEAQGTGEFGLAELGYYCGYWMIALGAFRLDLPRLRDQAERSSL